MKRIVFDIFLSFFQGLVYIKRGLIRLCVSIGSMFRPFFLFMGKLLVFPLYAVWSRFRRSVSKSPASQLHGQRVVGLTSLPIVISLITIGILFVGDSRVFAGEPVRGNVLLLEIFPNNRYGEEVIGQVIEGDEDGFVPEEEFLPLGGTVSGGRAIVAPTTLPGAPEEGDRRSTVNYVVQSGDTVGAVAERFGVSVETVLWENNLTARSVLRLGDVLKILPATGVRHTVSSGDTLLRIAAKYDIDVEEIKKINRLNDDSTLVIGESLLIPGGRPIRVNIPTRSPSSFAVRSPVSVPAARETGTTLLWPTSGRVITQYYHSRHSGLDIDGHYDSPIYASEGGVVVTAGWNPNGYGNYVIIDHGGGLRTLYAHASQLFVKAGQQLTRGEVIAMVGTTGRSTGTHLHYEVRVGNRRENPLRYTR